MRILYNLTLIFFSSILLNCQKQKSEIHYMGLYTTTITLVKCENLKKSTHLKKVTLSPEQDKEILNIFSQLKPIKENLDVDARLYGFINDGSQRLDFCMSATIIEINGKKYSVDNSLRTYIIKLTKK